MWSYELHPPHLINDDTLLCESRKPKMHVNTTSGFKFNYKIAVTCIKLHWQFHKMFWWIITNIHAIAFVQSVHQQHAHMISDGHASIDDIPVKVKTSLQQHWQVVDVMSLCFMHALVYNTDTRKFQAHDDSGPIWWSYDIQLMQFSLVISHCNIIFPVFWFHKVV